MPDGQTERYPRAPKAACASQKRRKRETLAEKRARAKIIGTHLEGAYPDVECPLTHRNNFELLVAVMLSAQCTDAAVNRVTPALFRSFPTSPILARAPLGEIESLIRTLGLFRAKARLLKRCAQQLVEEFGGEVPTAMEELTRLAGVGRKTANVIRGHAFGIPGLAVDTHCKRLSRRLGFTREEDPTKIERDLSRILPPEEWTGFSHRLILHGRKICYARKPACVRCDLRLLCPSSSV
ncbi:MAG TPA: endonuclease III [Terriglobales bacterium]|nr:endonuclease III [Terriglobales bacterium]